MQNSTARPHPYGKENTGEIIVMMFLDETNLGCTAMGKSFVLAELMLTCFSDPGTTKIHL